MTQTRYFIEDRNETFDTIEAVRNAAVGGDVIIVVTDNGTLLGARRYRYMRRNGQLLALRLEKD